MRVRDRKQCCIRIRADGIEVGGNAPNDDAYEKDPKKVPNIPVEIWQYSSKGVVPGIEPLVDLNAWIPEQTSN